MVMTVFYPLRNSDGSITPPGVYKARVVEIAKEQIIRNGKPVLEFTYELLERIGDLATTNA